MKLFKKNWNLFKKNWNKELSKAIRAGNLEDVKMAIRKGADLDNVEEKNGNTPLHIATDCEKSDRNTFKIVEKLLECGANPLKTNNLNITPLHLAISRENIGSALKLIEHGGADENIPAELGNNTYTQLAFAIEKGYDDIVFAISKRIDHLDICKTITHVDVIPTDNSSNSISELNSLGLNEQKKPSKEPIEKPNKESIEKPSEEPIEKPSKESIEKSRNNTKEKKKVVLDLSDMILVIPKKSDYDDVSSLGRSIKRKRRKYKTIDRAIL